MWMLPVVHPADGAASPGPGELLALTAVIAVSLIAVLAAGLILAGLRRR